VKEDGEMSEKWVQRSELGNLVVRTGMTRLTLTSDGGLEEVS